MTRFRLALSSILLLALVARFAANARRGTGQLARAGR